MKPAGSALNRYTPTTAKKAKPASESFLVGVIGKATRHLEPPSIAARLPPPKRQAERKTRYSNSPKLASGKRGAAVRWSVGSLSCVSKHAKSYSSCDASEASEGLDALAGGPLDSQFHGRAAGQWTPGICRVIACAVIEVAAGPQSAPDNHLGTGPNGTMDVAMRNVLSWNLSICPEIRADAADTADKNPLFFGFALGIPKDYAPLVRRLGAQCLIRVCRRALGVQG